MSSNVMFRDGYCIRDQKAPHFLTFTVCGWMDVFTRKIYRDIILSNLDFCRKNKGLLLHGYVIMSNHVHLLAATKNDILLSDLVRDLKSYTAHQILKIITSEKESRRHRMLHQLEYYGSRSSRNEKYQLWIPDNHPEQLLSFEMACIKLNYIHENPVRAGWVLESQHFTYSSAANYISGKGLIEIDYLL